MHKLLGKTNTVTLNLPSSFLLPPALYAEHGVTKYEIPLWQVGFMCPDCVSSQFLLHPQPACWWGEEHERPWLFLSAAQQSWKHPRVTKMQPIQLTTMGEKWLPQTKPTHQPTVGENQHTSPPFWVETLCPQVSIHSVCFMSLPQTCPCVYQHKGLLLPEVTG